MSKVDFTRLNSANVSVENSVDSERVYDIKCNANINNGVLNSIDSGIVIKDDVQVATFSMWANNLTPSFQNVTDATEMCNILMAITSFIEDTKKEIETNPIHL
jgi:hypothetical protein